MDSFSLVNFNNDYFYMKIDKVGFDQHLICKG